MIGALVDSSYIPFYVIAIALAVAFTPYKKLSLFFLAVALIVLNHDSYRLLEWPALLIIATLLSCCIFMTHSDKRIFFLTNTLFIVGSISLAIGLVPKIEGIMVVPKMQASSLSSWMSIALFANKALIAILLLCFISLPKRTKSQVSAAQLLIVSIAGIASILGLGLISGVIAWDPYLHQYTLLWFFDVLLLSVIGEEVFFRYYLQGYLLNKTKLNNSAVIIVSALIFALAHSFGGISLVVLSFIAGLLYSYLFQKTRTIFWPISIHMLLNLLHFLFFTYPTQAIS